MKNLQTTTRSTLSILAALVLGAAGIAVSQTGPPDAGELWETLKDAQYEYWAPYPGTPAGLYEGQRPHGAKLKTYVNRTAAANPDSLPAGSIIIKENYSPDGKLAAVTVMKKVAGYDSENQDWFWVKYQPDGSVEEQNGMKLAGKVQGCIGCHASAEGDDYVYTNDGS